MKRIISFILILATVLTSISFVSANNQSIIGDVDSDGIVSMKDSAIIARYVAGWKDYKKSDGSVTYPDDPSKPFAGRNTSGFCVGFNRVVITPPLNDTMPLGGFAATYNRRAIGKHDDICATSVAFKDAYGNIAIMVSVDVVNLLEKTADNFRNAISAKTGVPFDNIFMCCTHSHNGPDTHGDEYCVKNVTDNYLYKTYQQVALSALCAVRDLDHSEIYYGKTKTTNISFVRRWRVNLSSSAVQGPLKNIWGSNSMNNISKYLENETAADETVQYLVFKRSTQKPVLLYSWQCHAAITGEEKSAPKCTADFVNASKTKLEQDLDVLSVYYQGACGNINTNNAVHKKNAAYENLSTTYDKSQYIGTELAKVIEASYNAKSYSKISAGKIATYSDTYFAEYYDNSEEIQSTIEWRKSKFGNTVTYEEAERILYTGAGNITANHGTSSEKSHIQSLYDDTGIAASFYRASNIRRRYDRTHNSDGSKKTGAGANIPYYALTIGNNIAFAFASYEMFDSDAMDIKYGYHYIDNVSTDSKMNKGTKSVQSDNYSKFPCTFVIELTNASNSYIPSDLAWPHGGYEVECSYYVKGTGSAIAGNMIKMLNDAYTAAQ